MLVRGLDWYFVAFKEQFRRGDQGAFELVMFLSLGHFFGIYNPKQLADFLGIAPQRLYSELKAWSLYRLKKVLFHFMVKQAAEALRPILAKSAATHSRAGITLAVDNSVIDRLGRLLRCTWRWYSGRAKKVVNGQELLGIVLTVQGWVFPLHLLFVSKQGRANTDKPSLLISMFKQLVEAFRQEGIDITLFPITLDSWYASQDLKHKLHSLGFHKIIVAGKSNYVLTIEGNKQDAASWKKTLKLRQNQWGIEVPACRKKALSPTFGKIVVFFYLKRTTKTYYLMDMSQIPLRGAEIRHIWKQHHLIEWFWKTLKSTFKIKEMRLQQEGLYTGLVIKILAYLLALRLKAQRAFSKASITQIMRKIQRNYDLQTLLKQHFHLPYLITPPQNGT